MAKWGEGDPRWIVEERPDATNVNNWHWTEKNASNWSKEKLTELLLNLTIDETDVGCCRVTEITSIDGEAVANNRKGKLIFFYEWAINLVWTGKLNGIDEEVKGKIEIPNLSEENSAQEVDVNVSVDFDDFNSEILKGLMRNKGVLVIQEQIAKYMSSLRDEFARDMIKPSKLVSGGTINSFTSEAQSSSKSSNSLFVNNNQFAKTPENGETKKATDNKFETVSMSLSESFKCTADEFYRALTVIEMVQAFTQSKAILDATPNGRFELLDANITGIFTHLEPNKCIKQDWRHKSWPSNHYSQVTIEMVQKDDCTDVNIHQTNIPKNELERTEEGWKRYYFQSMKRTFGFGASLH